MKLWLAFDEACELQGGFQCCSDSSNVELWYGLSAGRLHPFLFFFFSLFVALLLPHLHMSFVLDVCWKSLGDTATKQSSYEDDA